MVCLALASLLFLSTGHLSQTTRLALFQNTGSVSIPARFPLWDGAAPGALGTASEDIPNLTTYLPRGVSTGAAFVICPGGGYVFLSRDEGELPAKLLSSVGITAFVLQYRLGPKYHNPVMKEDVMRAIRQVRFHAKEWGIDPNKIGIMGFSAGGHLAGTAATLFDSVNPNAPDPIDRVSSRPDAAVLVYPVITMRKSFTHIGSREALLGKNPSAGLVKSMSIEEQVTPQTPPCFVVASFDDHTVPIENSLDFVRACWKNHVPVEFHLYAHGEHGFALGGSDPALSQWPHALKAWLAGLNFLPRFGG